jgi:hypothetical protein
MGRQTQVLLMQLLNRTSLSIYNNNINSNFRQAGFQGFTCMIAQLDFMLCERLVQVKKCHKNLKRSPQHMISVPFYPDFTAVVYNIHQSIGTQGGERNNNH